MHASCAARQPCYLLNHLPLVFAPNLVQGYLLPAFHKAYWIGLQSPEKPYGTWSWIDSSPAPSKKTYTHWGMALPTYAKEPDMNFTCVSANASEAFEDPPAWGWSDASCDMLLPFMCKRAMEGSFVYVSNTTQATYILNTTQSTFHEAQAVCNDNGGHLVSYLSLEEQVRAAALTAWRDTYRQGVSRSGQGSHRSLPPAMGAAPARY